VRRTLTSFFLRHGVPLDHHSFPTRRSSDLGILATGAVPGAYFQYAPAPEEIMERVRRIEAVCARHGVRLPTAALQFPLGHPAVRSEEHTSELQSRENLVCRLLLEKKK